MPLTARDRAKMGTREPDTPTGIRASFVSFVRQGTVSRADTATFVKIPWSDRLADPQALMRIRIPVRDVVVTHEASWLEDLFWSQRYVASISYGDVGRLSLYPMYFEHRDRVVPLAPDVSLLLINFEEADHLKIDHVLPASASRRPSRTRADSEPLPTP